MSDLLTLNVDGMLRGLRTVAAAGARCVGFSRASTMMSLTFSFNGPTRFEGHGIAWTIGQL